jgi:glucose/arabinose dehydrogenase
MARTATRTVTVKRRAEMATIELRAGETTLGSLRGVAGTVGDSATMSGQFTHAPAYADFTERFLALATAMRDGDAARAAAERATLESAGVHVYHAQHEMRIDRPASVHMVGGEICFTPNDAYLMMRTGGL